MSKRQWLALLGFYLLYLLFGAAVFQLLEGPRALEEKRVEYFARKNLYHLAASKYLNHLVASKYLNLS